MQRVWLTINVRRRRNPLGIAKSRCFSGGTLAQRGYTLIELLLYVALIGILLSAVTALFSTAADARLKNQSINEVDDQGTYAMEYMAQTIRNATSISSPAAGATAAGLTLVVPTGTLSPTVFSSVSGALQVQEGTNTAVTLTNSKVQVTSLSFINLTRSGTSGVVQINLTLARINPSNLNTYSYQRTFTTSVEVRP